MYVGGKWLEKDEDRSKSVSDTNLACCRGRGNMSWTSVHRAVLEDPREALEAVEKETLTGLFSPRLSSRFKHDPGDHWLNPETGAVLSSLYELLCPLCRVAE